MEGLAGARFRWGSLIAIIVLLILSWIAASTESLRFTFSLKPDAFEFSTLIGFLGPALVASLFVERAVEVVVTTWRKLGREELESDFEQLTQAHNQANDANRQAAKDQLDQKASAIRQYRQDTLQMAVGVNLLFSFILALAGVRLLVQFFDIPYLDCLTGLNIDYEDCPSGQDTSNAGYSFLVGVDVFITTVIIAGGSAGLHSIVHAITTFADETAARARQAS